MFPLKTVDSTNNNVSQLFNQKLWLEVSFTLIVVTFFRKYYNH